jgi:hypothetical protein
MLRNFRHCQRVASICVCCPQTYQPVDEQVVLWSQNAPDYLEVLSNGTVTVNASHKVSMTFHHDGCTPAVEGFVRQMALIR